MQHNEQTMREIALDFQIANKVEIFSDYKTN